MNDQETVRMGGEVHAELLRLRAQNAALLEALRRIQKNPQDWELVLHEVRAALAVAKEG